MVKSRMYPIVITILVLLLVASNAISSRVLNRKTKEITETISSAMLYKVNLLYNYRIGVKKLNRSAILLNIFAAEVSLSSICENHNRLVFYYPNEICSTCYQDHFEKILENVDGEQLKGLDFCIFTKFENFRLMRLFVEQNNLSCEVYNIIENQDTSFLGLPEQPSFFIISKDCTLKSIYITGSNSNDLTSEYLSIVSNEF